MPNYTSSYNISNEVEENVNDHLTTCIRNHRASHPTHPLSVLVHSILHGGTENVEDLHEQLEHIQSIRTEYHIGYVIGYLNSIHCSSPIDVSIQRNCHGHCCIYVGESTLGLPERHMFEERDIVAKYKAYLRSVGTLCSIPRLDTVFTTEHRFAESAFHGKDEGSQYTFERLGAVFANIPWIAILEGFGCSDTVYTRLEYRISNVDYIRQLNTEFPRLGRADWIRWLQSMLLHTCIEYLPDPYANLHFSFYEHVLKGSIRKVPRSVTLLRILNDYVPQLLGSVCIGSVASATTKAHATALVQQLKRSTHRRITEATWLHASTRRKALDKVSAMLFQVAYPSRWRLETDGVPLHPSRLLTNLLLLSRHDTVRQIHQLLHDDCGRHPSRWVDSPFIVNAYYYSDKNMLMIPAGSLRPPFFDRRRSLAWNLGGVGSVIGHEISHGFDDDGRLYDEKGFCTNWWLPQDETAYHGMTQKIIKLFDGVPFMGGTVDGRRTLDENIADLCGVSIALGALRDTMATSSESERRRAYREFFISYATSWRTKMRPKKALFALRTSVHAPAKLRVNTIVQQFDEFYEAFDIRPGMEGWIAPAKRIRIW